MKRRFDQLDVFTAEPLRGNPLAVVHDAIGLDDGQMAAFARWTNLSETTFLLPPTDAQADYRVRIFTPGGELPFAGHPTLGSCHAWLAAGGRPRDAGMVVQQCGVGLVRVRRSGARLAFAAPPRRRSGPLDATLLTQILRPHATGTAYYQQTLALPADAPTGRWLLEARTDPASKRADAQWSFQVEEFLPERMKMGLQAPEAVLLGDAATLAVAAGVTPVTTLP